MKQILIGPKISEKSMTQTADGKYTFSAAKSANKVEISQAIEKLYKVKVVSIKTANTKGKIKNYRGRQVGRTRNIKKAIVKLAKGQKIADFNIKE